MFAFIEKRVERFFKKKLHGRRDIYINDAINAYIAAHHPDQKTVDELKAKLLLEIETAFVYGDGSTIKAGIVRAKWVFWLTAIISTLLTLPFAFPISAPLLIFLLPVLLTFATYIITVGTIPVSYDCLIRGAMDASIIAFEQRRQNRNNDIMPIPALRGMQQSHRNLENKNASQRVVRSLSASSISLSNKSYTGRSIPAGSSLWKHKSHGAPCSTKHEVHFADVSTPTSTPAPR